MNFNRNKSKYEDRKIRKNDCMIRAVHNATGVDMDTVYEIMYEFGWRKVRARSAWGWKKQVTGTLSRLGFEYNSYVSTEKRKTRPKIRTFAKTKSEGVFIVAVSGHLTCVKDGELFDSWNCSNSIVQGYWKIKVKPNNQNQIKMANFRKRDVLKAASELGCSLGETKRDGSKWQFEIKAPEGKELSFVDTGEKCQAKSIKVEWGGRTKKEDAFAEVLGKLETAKVVKPAPKEKPAEKKVTNPGESKFKDIAAPFTGDGDIEWKATEKLMGALQHKITATDKETGKKRTVALVSFTNSRDEKTFGHTEDGDVLLVTQAPEMFKALHRIVQLIETQDESTALTVAKNALKPLLK